jgi:hypothetical protein
MIDPELHAALIQNLCDLPPDHPDLQTTAAILREAAQFATNVLEPGAAPAGLGRRKPMAARACRSRSRPPRRSNSTPQMWRLACWR